MSLGSVTFSAAEGVDGAEAADRVDGELLGSLVTVGMESMGGVTLKEDDIWHKWRSIYLLNCLVVPTAAAVDVDTDADERDGVVRAVGVKSMSSKVMEVSELSSAARSVLVWERVRSVLERGSVGSMTARLSALLCQDCIETQEGCVCSTEWK
jgi:hypothetical protein